MRNVAIVGAGMTPFGEHFALGIKDLLPMAFADCARSVDKGLRKADLQAAWFGAMGTTDGFPSGILADSLGLPDLPVTRVENSCATGNDAVRNALFGVASGAFDVALVMGADKLRDTTSKDMLWEWEAMARDMAWDYPLGLVSPAGFALHVQRYLHESPATEEHLAMVAVKNHRHGVNNPKARLRFEITMEQAMTAPTVVTPFRLYDCAPQSDGAAALVIAAEDVVDRFTDRPVWIRGVGIGLDSVMHQHKPDMTTFTATVRAAKQAFSMAGMTPSDIDVAEVHDFFTGIELISYEDLGFAERYGAYKLLEAEVTTIGGGLPVNTSGGLKAKGHPPGATGVAQCVELFAQLRGEAVNQVDRRANRPRAQHRWPDCGVGGHDSGRTGGPWRIDGPQVWPSGGISPVPMQAIGGLFAMSADAVKFVFRRPFQWREFLEQSWFVARVSLAPTLLVAIPFTVLVSFTLNILLRELGAADLSGAGAAFGAVTQIGPLVTVLIVAGAGATAMCADLGLADHSRRDRRDGGAGHQPGAAPGDAADAGVRFGRAAAEQPGRASSASWAATCSRSSSRTSIPARSPPASRC